MATNLVNDAEIVYRFFLRRDEMNAEVHSTGFTRVRYSPITLAAERVLNSLYQERYKYEPSGVPVWKQASDFNDHADDPTISQFISLKETT